MVKSSGKRGSKQRQNCTICMVRPINCKTVECSHEFCYRCLSKWTRRKGNCPICRQEVRKVHYKNKVIQPEFLKLFDEEKLMLSEQLQIRPNRAVFVPYLFWNASTTNTPSDQQAAPFQMAQTTYFLPIYFGPTA